MKTYSAKPSEVVKKWILIDADGLVLGRLASIVANRLRGKHKTTYTPHVDCGDNVVVINAAKVKVTGTTMVNVINVGGSGAETGSGSADGISIVQVGDTSTANAFQLAGGYVAAGPYQYHLNAFDPAASADGELDPILAGLGATDFWDYRLQSTGIPVPQVAGYQSLPSGALQYGWSLLDSLHKRLGEFRHLAAVQTTDLDRGQQAELFLRGNGTDSDFDGDKGPDYDQTTWFIQGGGNFVGWDIGGAGSTLRGGFAASIGGSQVEVKTTSAKVELDGPGVALMGTYQDASGWYLDAVVQGTRYDATVKTSERGEVGNTDGWGLGL